LITKYGGTHEYFGDLARYIDPSSTASIAKGLVESFNAPKSEMLVEHIKNNFLWEKVGNKTIQAYDGLLEGRST